MLNDPMGRSHAFADVSAVVRRRMAKIGSTGTRPEMLVRRTLHGLGYRFRLHRRDLPGSPDLVFPARRKVIFVHGCFWHRHACTLARKVPRTRQEYWGPKLSRNVERDRIAVSSLEELGWGTLTIWECELADMVSTTARLKRFLGEPGQCDELIKRGT